MFALMSGGTLLTKRFETAAEAQKWAEWNSRGQGGYEVVPVREDGKVLVVRDIAPKKHEPECNCDKPHRVSGGRAMWHCPIHGNVFDEVTDEKIEG